MNEGFADNVTIRRGNLPWSSWINAEIYDRFVRERTIYTWLNRTLVRLADVSRAERILDLGCGTGATTLVSLGTMGSRAEIVGIDASSEMIQIARTNIRDPRATFVVAPASRMNHVTGSFDRVICNAALWQFPSLDDVFAAMRKCTHAGARVVFNAPAERVTGESTPIHPFQVTLMEEINRALGEPFLATAAMVDRSVSPATRHGFSFVRTDRFVYEGVQDELMELMAIPAMIGPLTPGLSDERREAVVARARARSDPQRKVSVPWIYFTLEREA